MNSQSIIPIAETNEAAPKSPFYYLIVDCQVKILRFLSPEVLGRIAEVCLHFRDLAVDGFKYEWRGKTVRLSNSSRRARLNSTTILRNFGYLLRDVRIDFTKNKVEDDKFLELFIEKCDSQLHTIFLSSPPSTVPCREFLEKVLAKESMQRLGTKFKNLITLRIDSEKGDISQPDCIGNQFPGSISQIKSLLSFNCNTVRDARSMVRIVDEHLPRLERFDMWVHGHAPLFRFEPRFLKALKYLKIHNFGNSANLQSLSISNERLEEMELETNDCDEILIDFICQYKELTRLTLHMFFDRPVDFEFLQKLKNHLPKLSELDVCGFWEDLHHTEIVHFVHRSKHLVKLILRCHKWKNVLASVDNFQKKLNPAIWKVGYIADSNDYSDSFVEIPSHFLCIKKIENSVQYLYSKIANTNYL